MFIFSELRQRIFKFVYNEYEFRRIAQATTVNLYTTQTRGFILNYHDIQQQQTAKSRTTNHLNLMVFECGEGWSLSVERAAGTLARGGQPTMEAPATGDHPATVVSTRLHLRPPQAVGDAPWIRVRAPPVLNPAFNHLQVG